MARSDSDHPQNLIDEIKTVFDTRPEVGADGIGPTLGQDLGKPNADHDEPADERQDAQKAQAKAEALAARDRTAP